MIVCSTILILIRTLMKIFSPSLFQEKEFLKMFQMPVIEVPPNLPNIRKDLPIQAFAVGHSIFVVYFE